MRQTRVARKARRGRMARALMVLPLLISPIFIYVTWTGAWRALAAGESSFSSPQPPARPAPGTAGPAVAETTQVPAPGTLRLSFVGDILLAGTVGELIRAEGPMAPWKGVKDLLSDSDLTCGNLECPVGTTGAAVEGKTWTFRADPAVVQGLKESGLDVVSLANNHALDYGTECMLETIDLVRGGGVAVIGAGINEEAARAPFIFEKNGIKVGILATAELVPYPTWAATKDSPGLAVDYYGWYPGIVSSIKGLATKVDTVVVLIHWGEERTRVPVERLADIAQALKDAGAHAVIGTHPHVLEGIEYDGRILTAHSLGNFVFSTRPDIPELQAGAVLNLTVSKGKVESASVAPTQIVWGRTVPAAGSERVATVRALASLSRPLGTDVSAEGEIVPLFFTDMLDHWARFSAGKLACRGAITGYADGTFRPGAKITKGEFAAMFSRLVSSPREIATAKAPERFALCAETSWAYAYLKYLAASGAVGPSDAAWSVDNECSRLEACVAIWRYATRPDSQQLNAQDNNAVTWAVGAGILRGDPDGSLRLERAVTRAEMAEILLRYAETKAK